jgi:hypothetical protein
MLKRPLFRIAPETIMNFIELLIFMILSGLLLAAGHIVAGKWEAVGWLIGGVPVGLFWSWVLVCFARSALMEFRHYLSPRPLCRQSRCRSRHYVLIDSTQSKATFRCRCGDLYLRDGDHFWEILPDHSLSPYMVHDSAGKWKTDLQA